MGWIILGGIVLLIIQIAIANKFGNIAEDKGHDKAPYFWVCFLLGIIGYIMVAALPDITVYDYIVKSLNPKSEKNHSLRTGNNSTNTSSHANGTMWECKYCLTYNKSEHNQCKNCGQYRS